MKMLTLLAILVFVFTSCTSVLYQEGQQEGKDAIENYEDARMKYDPEKMTSELKAQLIGKWQLIGIEVEKDTVNAQTTNPKSKAAKQHPLPIPTCKRQQHSNRLGLTRRNGHPNRILCNYRLSQSKGTKITKR